ncbi:cation:proton antiporter [Bradyrhizobium sp. AZCC 2289]|uniref:cation:proton antiporter n=1 Tax=Bradyrhizobium sp. AZCC 2289 TaxID=3117026 RepID=UPI002FF0ADBA
MVKALHGQPSFAEGLAQATVTLERPRLLIAAPRLCALILFSLADVTDAFAAEVAKGPSEVVFLAQLIALMVIGRLLGEAMNRIGQPSVMGMLLAGVLLGPSVLGTLSPEMQIAIFPKNPEQKAMMDGISQFGILLLLLLTGMETDLKLVRRVGQAALSISLSGVAVPFLCGFALGQLLPESLLPHPDQRLLTSLFLGTALSISSIKIVAAVVREMGFTRRNLGQIIVASAICEDSVGWVIIAITLSLAEAGTIDVASVAKSVLGTAIFLAASFTVGRRLVFFAIRWANDSFESDFPVVTTILVIMGLMALTTHFIGVHTVLGAFVAGILIGESPIMSKHIDEQLRGLILAFFMPVFFGIAGLSADLAILRNPELAIVALGLISVASLGKFAGAFLGGTIGGLTRRESLALGCAMNARGSTEIIVATIGLSMGALSQDLFTMIVAMAVVTTMAMPPMLRWTLRRVPIRKSEKERLEREQQEAKGFVSNLERLLLAVDDSPNGKFAARLTGLIAGQRGMPTTLLSLQADKKSNGSDSRWTQTPARRR